MHKLNVAKYKSTLLEEKVRLHKEIEHIEEDTSYSDQKMGQSELADYDNHPGDTGSDTFEKEKDVSVIDTYHNVIGRIDEALGKIERGTYGTCDRCGREIAKGRLNAVPYAIYCLECQDIIEGR